VARIAFALRCMCHELLDTLQVALQAAELVWQTARRRSLRTGGSKGYMSSA